MADKSKPIRVLVIDDSAFNRQTITSMLSDDPEIEVIGRAADGNEGLKQVVANSPDIITLDLEMPRMDGYTFLRILMNRKPTPVIIISSHSDRESVFKALELGALDFIAKPARAVSPELNTISRDLVEKIKLMGRLRKVFLVARTDAALEPVAQDKSKSARRKIKHRPVQKLICIGASTGGPPALKRVFEQLPADLGAALLITQHMPATFTTRFARRLHDASRVEVQEAEDGAVLRTGLAYVAPGNASITVENQSGELKIKLEPKAESKTAIVPSVDRMMETAAAVMGKDVLGIVLTGMGEDGSQGVVSISDAGGATVAEAEETAVVFGMPGAAIRTKKVQEIIGIDGIAKAMIRFSESKW